ncbi:hypothetical protein OGATHE_005176 [Ogataea polymorpha]|uniref:Uncharacterized protein n=1 Tax=Ogataea polymorpha TaxID=460523 RepID=A0A9P8T063_9ASCO|nr:hypothetical protein OGATHE_005176 [Ogataea polymorpha]
MLVATTGMCDEDTDAYIVNVNADSKVVTCNHRTNVRSLASQTLASTLIGPDCLIKVFGLTTPGGRTISSSSDSYPSSLDTLENTGIK